MKDFDKLMEALNKPSPRCRHKGCKRSIGYLSMGLCPIHYMEATMSPAIRKEYDEMLRDYVGNPPLMSGVNPYKRDDFAIMGEVNNHSLPKSYFIRTRRGSKLMVRQDLVPDYKEVLKWWNPPPIKLFGQTYQVEFVPNEPKYPISPAVQRCLYFINRK